MRLPLEVLKGDNNGAWGKDICLHLHCGKSIQCNAFIDTACS